MLCYFVLQNLTLLNNETFYVYSTLFNSIYINTISHGIVYMKSYSSEKILNDPIKRNVINQLFAEIKMDLTNIN